MLIQLTGSILSNKECVISENTLIELQKTLLSQDYNNKLKGNICKNLYWLIYIQGADTPVIE